MNKQPKKAYFGGGCFWCTEAIFTRLKGVHSVAAGYSGGTTEHPTYKEVSKKKTGHTETIEIQFDEEIIPYTILLDVFFSTHNPTTLNRQGSDIGEQYRSAIFYLNPEQRQQAENYIEQLTNEQVFKKPIVTSVEPFKAFYKAEEEHQHYYDNNPKAPYCTIVIAPKIKKLQENFQHLLKEQ